MMRTISHIATGGVVAAALFAGGAQAAVLYSNGPYDGAIDGLAISYGYSVADAFTAIDGSAATDVAFVTWNSPGDTASTVDWEITSGNPLGGGAFDVLGSGTAATSATDIGLNGSGYDLQTNSFSVGSVTLTGGDYWLLLQNAYAANGDPVAWDVNNGPAAGWDSTLGAVNSETFTVSGDAVPEPTGWSLMLLGLGGLGAQLRSRRGAAAASL